MPRRLWARSFFRRCTSSASAHRAVYESVCSPYNRNSRYRWPCLAVLKIVMKPYPVELRSRIVDAVDRGVGSLPTIAALFSVSITCVANYLELREQTGSLEPRPNPGGRTPAITEERYPEVQQLLQQQPDLTLDQIRERLQLSCSLAAISRTLSKLGLTRKKKALHAAEQQRPDVQAARDAWAEWQAQLTEDDLQRLVFWDETATYTNMVPLYGRSLPGERIVEHVSQGDWQRLTLIGGVRLSGLCGALMFEGSTTVEACETFVTCQLGPQVQAGDIVIMDNLSSHVNPAVVQLLESLGVQVKRLPAYSPDLNPIEQVWSKIKQLVRRLRPRTAEALMDAVGAAMHTITPEDIRGWFEHCGYQTDS
jgi:transposase